jgi:hypothetical protein
MNRISLALVALTLSACSGSSDVEFGSDPLPLVELDAAIETEAAPPASCRTGALNDDAGVWVICKDGIVRVFTADGGEHCYGPDHRSVVACP